MTGPADSGTARSADGGNGGLVGWAEATGRGRREVTGRGGLRFAFYGRVSTEDHQDPVTSRARQLSLAKGLTAGYGRVVAEFFDAGQSRTIPWARRPEAAALVAAMADPDRGFDAIVVGEYDRAFYGGQCGQMAPLFEHYGMQLWTPEAGGPVDFAAADHELLMVAMGLAAKAGDHPHEDPGPHRDGRAEPGAGPVPRRAAAVRVPARRCGPAPEQGAGRVGTAGPPPRSRPADRTRGGVDVRRADRRPFHRADRPRPERGRDPVPVG